MKFVLDKRKTLKKEKVEQNRGTLADGGFMAAIREETVYKNLNIFRYYQSELI